MLALLFSLFIATFKSSEKELNLNVLFNLLCKVTTKANSKNFISKKSLNAL